MENEEIKKLQKRVAQLESENDYLLTELEAMDGLLRSIGFKYGLESAKMAAAEILRLITEAQEEETEECEN